MNSGNQASEDLRVALYSRPGESAKQLIKTLQISQPRFSRLVGTLKDQLLIVGKSTSTRYALRRNIQLASGESNFFPLYIINDVGNAILAADLIAVTPHGFYVDSKIQEIKSAFYSDIPYFLDDLRPTGFLGRLVPIKYPELGFPADVRAWNSDTCVRYWATLGIDLIGNYLVGENAFAKHTQSSISDSAVAQGKRRERYLEIAKETLLLGAAGSSAGGEQPKFLTSKSSSSGILPVLVKFSPEDQSPASVRIRDLLTAEYLALKVLRQVKKSVPEAEIVNTPSRLFLELVRFDRTQEQGRLGIITLAALDAQFAGLAGSSWREIATALRAKGILNEQDYGEILWRYYFGLCIANTDMHAYNLSFYCYGENLRGLAPIYDMLPMHFSPRGNEVLDAVTLARSYKNPVLYPNDIQYWQPAQAAALRFWQTVSVEGSISAEFKAAAKEMLKLMA